MIGKVCTVLLMSLFLTPLVYAQNKSQLKQKVEDTFDELEKEVLTLRFFNALNGEPIPGAKVTISDLGTFTSDFEGKVQFEIPEDGPYVVTFEKSGFIKSPFKIEIMAGTLFFNRFSISPAMPMGYVRIVLDWGEDPRDLDAHLKKRGGYHISYRNMKVSNDRIARLDRDDVTSFGPETITVNRVDQRGLYHYFIHDYTNRSKISSRQLSDSRACVKVYGGNNELLHVFQVPERVKGNYWHVFTIENAQVVPVDRIVTREP